MKRGDLYRVRRPPGDSKPARVVVVVSRQSFVDANFSSVVCAPIFSKREGLPSQVAVGASEGLKHDSAILCDALLSIDKSRLTDFVGKLSQPKLNELDTALAVALGLRRL